MPGGQGELSRRRHRGRRRLIRGTCGRLVAGALFLCAFSATADPAAPDPALSLSQVKLRLIPAKTSWKPGEVPEFSAELENTGKGEVLLLGCLDGSFSGRRGPFLTLEMKDAAGEKVASAPPGPRCGNSVQLSVSDFFVLKPGGTHALTLGAGCPKFQVAKAGRYTVTLSYRLAEPFEVPEGLNGPVDADTKALEGKLPRGELRAEPVTLEFRQ